MGNDTQRSPVLMVDDESIVIEIVETTLQSETDIQFSFETNALNARATAIALQSRAILADLKIPAIDRFGLIQQFQSYAGKNPD